MPKPVPKMYFYKYFYNYMLVQGNHKNISLNTMKK